MRNRILGFIGVFWGAAILIVALAGHTAHGSGAYGAGQTAGPVFGAVFLIAGARAVVTSFR